MRRGQKKQAEDFIRILGRAHDEIRKAIEEKKDDIAMELLELCQDGAKKLGDMIEKIEGEYFKTIPLLEKYCELVYRIYERIEQGQVVNAEKAFENLFESLLQIENSVHNDIKIRREVVFLPYKASMWDSLESVWKAATEDPECDVYVIPIPYYDKNPDGSYCQEHYEGNLYPGYVPVTRYDAFDFEAHHPDTIFIHNPYDEYNYVTSVYPFFYSRNLKQYTEQLVYIPYFILNEIKPSNQSAVKGIAHFCTVPGVVYADKVVVQSEDMRHIYVNVMTEAAGNDTRTYWENKILGLGSPKIDKVLNTRKEDYVIPDGWLKLIQKPDGSRKKIVFYNTSVSALLEYGGKMLAKIKDVFHIFEENKDEIALLWRPHPLMKATIESMRPQLWEEYDKIVQRYKEDGWGIYDDTVDIDRAVILSDAYYGDASSVVQLCQMVGKQALIQSIYWKNNIKYAISFTEAIVEMDDEYWFIPYFEKILYRMNKWTYEIQKVVDIEETGSEGLFIGIVRCESKLYILPKIADYIVVYSLPDKDIHYLSFKNNEEADPVNSSFFDYKIVGESIYLIPCKYDDIVQIHMESERIEKFRIPRESEENRVCMGNAAVLGEDIYIPFESETCLLKFNLENKSFNKIILNNEKIKYTHIFNADGKLWLIPYTADDGIRIWDVQNNIFETVGSLSDKNNSYFTKGIKIGNNIFLLAATGMNNIVIHINEKQIETWRISPSCDEWRVEEWCAGWRNLAFFHTSEKLFTICGLSGEWFQYLNGEWEIVTGKAKYKDNIALNLDHTFLYLNNLDNEVVSSNCGKQIYEMLKEDG